MGTDASGDSEKQYPTWRATWMLFAILLSCPWGTTGQVFAQDPEGTPPPAMKKVTVIQELNLDDFVTGTYGPDDTVDGMLADKARLWYWTWEELYRLELPSKSAVPVALPASAKSDSVNEILWVAMDERHVYVNRADGLTRIDKATLASTELSGVGPFPSGDLLGATPDRTGWWVLARTGTDRVENCLVRVGDQGQVAKKWCVADREWRGDLAVQIQKRGDRVFLATLVSPMAVVDLRGGRSEISAPVMSVRDPFIGRDAEVRLCGPLVFQGDTVWGHLKGALVTGELNPRFVISVGLASRRLNGSEMTAFEVPDGPLSLLGRGGRIWIGGFRGVYVLDPMAHTLVHLKPTAFSKDEEGRVYNDVRVMAFVQDYLCLGTLEGVRCFDLPRLERAMKTHRRGR